MKLRDRLFLWVGVLFFATLLVSAFFEGYFTRKSLNSAEDKLRRQILESSDQKRLDIESFLRLGIHGMEANVNTLLGRVVEFFPMRQDFLPTARHLHRGTWLESTSLLLFNRWVDFLQNDTDQELLSLLTPRAGHLHRVDKMPIAPSLSWVVPYQGGEPLLAVAIQLIPIEPSSEDLIVVSPEFHVLFPWRAVMRFDETWQKRYFSSDRVHRHTMPPVPGVSFSQNVEGLLDQFTAKIVAAHNYLQQEAQRQGTSDLQSWIEQQVAGYHNDLPPPSARTVSCVDEIDAILYHDYARTMERDDAAVMMWLITVLLDWEAFGSSPFSSSAPAGVAKFGPEAPTGRALWTEEMFSATPRFADQAHFRQHLPLHPCFPLASSLAVIAPPNENRAFLGNTLRLPSWEGGEARSSYLTVGVGLDMLLKQLVLSLHQPAFLVHGGRVIHALNAGGEVIDPHEGGALPLNEMLHEQYGIIPWRDIQYFFLHLHPVESLDLHIFVLNPAAKQFALLDSVDEGTKNLVAYLSNRMRGLAIVALVLALIVLYRIARKITDPITLLAKATVPVAAGNYSEVHLPELSFHGRDEVGQLYHSFGQMVEGMQEKEKVQGILNKVVSREIAQEILRSGVSLGGEEKEVTVLFADIRGFTQMTQHLSPQQVVALLNACMTKVSQVIDRCGGVIDKYVGDEVMALFGAPVAHEQSALRAIQAALGVVEELEHWHRTLWEEGREPIQMGIGIHTGPVLAGNMGAENRLNYTVLGSNVNLAARVCSIATPMQILITESTLKGAGVEAAVEVRALPPQILKGFDVPTALYEVVGLHRGTL